MVYFYSASVDTERGKLRVDGAIEINVKIISINAWHAAQKQLKDNIRSELKEKEGIEIYNIVLIAFNRI